MACPLVAGVCGLVKSRRPEWTPAQVAQHLVDTGQNVAYDHPLGVKVDAFAAVEALAVTPVEEPPNAPSLALTCAPNPFNPRTEIRFAQAAAGPVRLEIFDARGRLVRTLLNEVRAAGSQSVVWNGGDDAGREVASGVYLVRLATASGTTTAKALLAR
jgi:hypothetical protein